MNRSLPRLALLIAGPIILAGSACVFLTEPARGQPGSRPAETSRKVRVLVLEGTPYNRGLTHGKAMKQQIHEVAKLWKEFVAAVFKTDADAFFRRFVRETNFLSAIKKWTPDLVDEIRGMAEGAGVDFDTMLTLQLPDEVFVNGKAIAGEHCTSLGFDKKGTQPACIAQNMDVPAFADGFQVVLHVKEPNSDVEAFVLTQAGCIGFNGMNNHSVGICCNALWMLNSSRDGLPVACIVRGVLKQPTEADAVAFVRNVKHASGQNYIVGGLEHAYSFECSAHKVTRFQPYGRDDVVWHTNNPLANDDCDEPYRALRADPEELEKKEANSRSRLHCVERRMKDNVTARELEHIKGTLSSYPVCCAKKDKYGSFTFASTIMVLGEKPVLHIAPGPPNVTPFESLSFTPAK